LGFPRSSGILLHPTSLPGRFGIGDLGDDAYRFADFLVASGQRLWQVLPLGPTGFGDSPYQCFSAFAGNTLLISPERLVADGLLSAGDLRRVPTFRSGRVEFGKVIDYKTALFEIAFTNFKARRGRKLYDEFRRFCRDASGWLEDYALFRAIKSSQREVAWSHWPAALARRDEKALASARGELKDKIESEKLLQFLFFRQWSALKEYCHRAGISIIGDAPIFVAADSVDVWRRPELFKLDANRRPVVVAGVPPDYFSKTGQLWGNPIYNWEQMRKTGFDWWVQRLRHTLAMVDILRIDHFRGFAASWEVPAGNRTAKNGSWVKVPGRELFTVLKQTLNALPIIAEDLGVITPDVEALRDDFELPGMRILQFAFSGDSRVIHLPHNYRRNSVVYTGTHDNDTTIGWFKSRAGRGSTRSAAQIKHERQFCMKYLRTDGKEIQWDFIRAVLASVASMALVPLQDVLGLGSSARMNLPATPQGNWTWRFAKGALTKHHSNRLRELSEFYNRSAD
jgi:4-alpha-glucanotransferase